MNQNAKRAYRSTLFLMGLSLVIALSRISQAEEQAKSSQPKTFMVQMRDGVKLATDVYLPNAKGKFPTILARTPYGRKLGLGSYVRKAREKGYAVVVQDMRGRFDSEGKAFVFTTDREDGHDTIRWIAKQPFSDGRVGTFGPSALGIAQYALAPDAPKALKCMFVEVATTNPSQDGYYQGGVFRLGLVGGWLVRTGLSKDHLKHVYRHDPLTRAFMKKLNFRAGAGKVHIPVMHVGGWFDIFTEGILDAYQVYQKQGGKGARGKQKLMIGPWNHGVGSRHAGDFTFPQNAEKSLDPTPWFERCIKGKFGGVDAVPPVQIYTMGAVGEKGAPGNFWEKKKDWAPTDKKQALYLHQNGDLSKQKPSEKNASKTYLFDPEDYVPYVCGSELTLRTSPCDQREVEDREDVLLFTSQPLTHPLQVTGKVQAEVYVSSEAKDTDFTAKLTDVYPDGRSILIADNILRTRFREGLDKEVWLQPGVPVKITIKLGSTSLIFNKGHRIRLAISSSNFPRFLVNPNTGGDLSLSQQAINHIFQFGLSQEYEPALIYDTLQSVKNTIYFDQKHPSHLILPVPL